MNLKKAQKQVDDWIKLHGVRYFDELTNMAQLTEEVGEVASIIARRYGEQSEKSEDKNKDLGEELADVLFVLLCIANQTGINLQSSFDTLKEWFLHKLEKAFLYSPTNLIQNPCHRSFLILCVLHDNIVFFFLGT